MLAFGPPDGPYNAEESEERVRRICEALTTLSTADAQEEMSRIGGVSLIRFPPFPGEEEKKSAFSEDRSEDDSAPLPTGSSAASTGRPSTAPSSATAPSIPASTSSDPSVTSAEPTPPPSAATPSGERRSLALAASRCPDPSTTLKTEELEVKALIAANLSTGPAALRAERAVVFGPPTVAQQQHQERVARLKGGGVPSEADVVAWAQREAEIKRSAAAEWARWSAQQRTAYLKDTVLKWGELVSYARCGTPPWRSCGRRHRSADSGSGFTEKAVRLHRSRGGVDAMSDRYLRAAAVGVRRGLRATPARQSGCTCSVHVLCSAVQSTALHHTTPLHSTPLYSSHLILHLSHSLRHSSAPLLSSSPPPPLLLLSSPPPLLPSTSPSRPPRYLPRHEPSSPRSQAHSPSYSSPCCPHRLLQYGQRQRLRRRRPLRPLRPLRPRHPLHRLHPPVPRPCPGYSSRPIRDLPPYPP